MNIQIFQSWFDFYPDHSSFIQIPSNQFYSQIESGHYYCTSSYFLDLSQDGSSGALSFTSNTEKYILIEKVYFYNCSSKTGSGGAVYFNGLTSLIFHQICIFHCYLIKSGQSGTFCRAIQPSTSQNKFSFLLSSCIESTQQTNFESSLHFYYGNQNVETSNISNNQYISLTIWLQYPTTSPTFVKYCSFLHNFSPQYGCTYLDGLPGNSAIPFSFYYNNIVNNTLLDDTVGLILSHRAIIDISFCYFFNNNAKFIFASFNEGRITSSYSLITHPSGSIGGITSINNIIAISEIPIIFNFTIFQGFFDIIFILIHNL